MAVAAVVTLAAVAMVAVAVAMAAGAVATAAAVAAMAVAAAATAVAATVVVLAATVAAVVAATAAAAAAAAIATTGVTTAAAVAATERAAVSSPGHVDGRRVVLESVPAAAASCNVPACNTAKASGVRQRAQRCPPDFLQQLRLRENVGFDVFITTRPPVQPLSAGDEFPPRECSQPARAASIAGNGSRLKPRSALSGKLGTAIARWRIKKETRGVCILLQY
jgi:hypothetical protein